MFKLKNREGDGIAGGVMTAYSILLLHVALIALVGLLVLFFNGIISYMFWIFLIGMAALVFAGYRWYQRYQQQANPWDNILHGQSSPSRSLEISFLGGLARVKIGASSETDASSLQSGPEIPQLEDSATQKIRELNDLVRLLENNLITLEEYNALKKRMFEG